jgi:gamma-glutamyl phosphate reductase
MEIYDVVKKLLGPIEPVGETRADDERYENLQTTITLIDKLLLDIDHVSSFSSSHEFSVSRAGKRAKSFLKTVKEI